MLYYSHRLNSVSLAGWEASYSAANTQGILSTEDRLAICTGICYILASLPSNQHEKSLLALAMPSLDCFERMLKHANTAAANSSWDQTNVILERISSEIMIITTMTTAFTEAVKKNQSTTLNSKTAAINESAMPILKRVWPSVSSVASSYNYHDVSFLDCTVSS